MDWKALETAYTELNHTFTVSRPALVIELYGSVPKLWPHGEEIFDRFLQLVSDPSSLHVMGGNDRQYKAVTPASARRIRKTLGELSEKGQHYRIKDAAGFDVRGFSLEASLGSDTRTVRNDAVYVTLPLGWAEAGGLEATVGVFAALVRSIPFWAGVASYGFDMVWGREFEQVAMPDHFGHARRFMGLLLRDRNQEVSMMGKLKSAGWLTYLDGDLVERAGGEEALRAELEGKVTIANVGAGLLFRTGTAPPLGDVNVLAPDVGPLAALNRALRKIRLERWFAPGLFGVDRDTADQWLKRFDK